MDEMRFVTSHSGAVRQVNFRANHETIIALLERMAGGSEGMEALTFDCNADLVAMMLADAASMFTAHFGALLVYGTLMSRHVEAGKRCRAN